jgi:hypothetical protein
MPERKASETLRKALLKGTRSGGVTLARFGVYQHEDQVHQYYGCPQNPPCDSESTSETLPWESVLLNFDDPSGTAAR